MIKNVDKVEALLKLPEGTLKTALESTEEVEITLPNLIVRTPEEDEQFKTNLRTAGVEIAAKKQAELLGLTLNADDKRDISKVFEAFKVKTLEGVNVEPNEKVKMLESDKAKLQENYSDLENQFIEFKNKAKSQMNSVLIDAKIESSIAGDLILPKEDVKALFKTKYAVEIDENGNDVVKKDGEILKNQTTLNPLSLKEVMNTFLPNYSKKPEGGAGQGDNAGAQKGTLEAFEKEMEGRSQEEKNKIMEERIKEGSLKI
jgi:hypothetical protein